MLWAPATSVNFLGYCRCSAALTIEHTETEQMWEAYTGSVELIRTGSPKIDSSELTPPKKKYFFQVNTSRKTWLLIKTPHSSFLEWLCSQALIIFCRLKQNKICSYSHLNLSDSHDYYCHHTINIKIFPIILIFCPPKLHSPLFFFYAAFYYLFVVLFFCALVVNYVLYMLENSNKSTRSKNRNFSPF